MAEFEHSTFLGMIATCLTQQMAAHFLTSSTSTSTNFKAQLEQTLAHLLIINSRVILDTQKYCNTYVDVDTSSDPSEALQLSLDLPEEDEEEENEPVTEQLSALYRLEDR